MAMTKEGLQSEHLEKQHNNDDFNDSSAEIALQKSYLRCVEVLEGNDSTKVEDFKHDALSSPDCADTGQPLIDKPPISSSIIAIPLKNAIEIGSSASCSDLDIDPLKRPFSPDTSGRSEKEKVNILESNDDIILKFDNEQELQHAGLVEWTNATSKEVSTPVKNFDLLPLSSNKLTWDPSPPIHQDQSSWSPLEDALSSIQRSQPKKPVVLESCDSSFSSSSIEDGTNELQELFKGESFSQKRFGIIEEIGTWNLEKLPKEDKEEVEKFLKGFSKGSFEWTSDTEESSYSESSSIDEEKVISTTSTGDVSFDASEAEEAGIYPKRELLSDINVSCGEERLEKHKRNSYFKQATYLISDASLPLRQEHLHNVNKEVFLYDDKGKQAESRNESDRLQVLPLNEHKNFPSERISSKASRPLFELTINADDYEQETLLPVRFESSQSSHINENKADETCEVNDECGELMTTEKTFSLESKDKLKAGVSNNKVILLLKAEENICPVWSSSYKVNKETKPCLSENDIMLVNNADQSVFTGTHCVLDQDQETLSFVPTGEGLVLEECMVSDSNKNHCRIEMPFELVIHQMNASSQSSSIQPQYCLNLETQSLEVAYPDLDMEFPREQSSSNRVISTGSHIQTETFSASSEQADVGSSEKVVNLTAISSEEHIISNCLAFNGTQTNSLPVGWSMQFKLGHQAHMQESATDLADNLSKLLNAIGEGTRSSDVALIPLSGVIPFSGPISLSGSIPFSGSISLRSDSSSNSTRSFAFPILPSEWNSSPVKMAPADCRYQSRKRQWRLCYFCCRKPATKV